MKLSENELPRPPLETKDVESNPSARFKVKLSNGCIMLLAAPCILLGFFLAGGSVIVFTAMFLKNKHLSDEYRGLSTLAIVNLAAGFLLALVGAGLLKLLKRMREYHESSYLPGDWYIVMCKSEGEKKIHAAARIIKFDTSNDDQLVAMKKYAERVIKTKNDSLPEEKRIALKECPNCGHVSHSLYANKKCPECLYPSPTAIIVSCKCGKVFRVAPEQAGKTTICPVCKSPLTVPILLSCECGKDFRIKREQVGMMRNCPVCKSPLTVPEF